MSRPLAAVTGASAGIGSVFARKLAARGYDLLLIARRRERMEALSAELGRSDGAACESLAADLATPEDIERVAERIAGEPRLAMLVNNAGFGTKGRFWEAPLKDQVRMHRLHIDATMRLTHAALGGMTARNSGSIINVSSVAAFARSASNVSYCATKAYVNAFTEGVYVELKGRGSRVRVQALCPGFTMSEFHDVMHVNRAEVPKWMWLRADEVVEASLAGLERGRLFVIPDWKYKLFVAVLTKFPAAVRVGLECRDRRTRKRL